jgi:hypothetical protein
MNNINNKIYNVKKPAHPDTAHAKSKNFFNRPNGINFLSLGRGSSRKKVEKE